MNVSLGEVEAAVLKGARGAGHAWGIAEEAAKAARWLAARGLPCVEVIVPMFEGVRTEGCPLAIGCALVDLPDESVAGSRTFAGVVAPILLLPFVARAAKATGTAVRVRWPGVDVTLDGMGEIAAWMADEAGLVAPTATVAVEPGAAPAPHHLGRVPIGWDDPSPCPSRKGRGEDPRGAVRPPPLAGGEGGGGCRVDVSDDLWARLDELVVLTYVPESDESRRRGAGAVALEVD